MLCTEADYNKYLLSLHFFWQTCGFSAVMYISVRTLRRRKLQKYSVDGLKTRLVKWLPITKTLQNQISLDILSRSCQTFRYESSLHLLPQRAAQNKRKKTAGKDNCDYQQSHLTNKRLTGMCHCLGAQTENPSGCRPGSSTTT